MNLTLGQLQLIMPHLKDAPRWVEPINDAAAQFGIKTPGEMAMFLAQVAHESAELTRMEENLNYSADALVRVWPKRFTAEVAKQYHRNPERIANKVYANRMGNGDEASGEGWKYRGRGPIQITGKDMYRQCGNVIGLNLILAPNLLLDSRQYAMQSAAWFFIEKAAGLECAKAGDLRRNTRLINGGYNGLEDREKYYNLAKRILNA